MCFVICCCCCCLLLRCVLVLPFHTRIRQNIMGLLAFEPIQNEISLQTHTHRYQKLLPLTSSYAYMFNIQFLLQFNFWCCCFLPLAPIGSFFFGIQHFWFHSIFPSLLLSFEMNILCICKHTHAQTFGLTD